MGVEKLKLVTVEVSSEPGPSELLLEWVAAPMNPADVNMIQGTYPLKPPLPAIGGNEGVARVKKVGLGMRERKEGESWRRGPGRRSARALW